MEQIVVRLLDKKTRRMVNRVYPLWRDGEYTGEVVYWKKAVAGQMALSDDGWVGECLYTTQTKTNRPKDPSRGYHLVRTVYGYQLNSPGTRLYAKIKMDHDAKNYRTTKARDTVKAYVAMRLSGKMDYEALARIYRMDQAIPVATVKRFIRQQRTQAMIRQELSKILTVNGITPDMILTEYRVLLDSCKENGVVKDKPIFKETLDTLSEMADLVPDRVEMSANYSLEVPTGMSMMEIEEMNRKLIEASPRQLKDSPSDGA